MRSVVLWVVILIMVSVLVSCAELPAADVTESEIQTEAMVESETGKENESEEETESETEWTPILMEDKLQWIDEIWPEWEMYAFLYEDTGEIEKHPLAFNRNRNCDEYLTQYYRKWSHGYPDTSRYQQYLTRNVGKVMYSTCRQLVYGRLIHTEFAPNIEPNYGRVIVGVLEEGEPVYVVEEAYNQFRPEDGPCYLLNENRGTPFFDDYLAAIEEIRMNWPASSKEEWYGVALYLSNEPPENRQEIIKVESNVEKKVSRNMPEWVNDVWKDWSDWDGSVILHASLSPQNEITQKLCAFVGCFYENSNSSNWFEMCYMAQSIDSFTYIQTERIDRIMYATENQLVYYKIITASDQPLKEPYCGFVVGALEKGDAVRVVSVIENQKNPDDPIFYGIAYEPSLGTAPFMDSYIDPFIELLDGLDPELTSFGFANKLSETPPTE